MPRNPILPFTFLCLLVLAGACYTNQLTLNILEPAAVTLPASIHRISILPLPGFFSKPGVFDSISHITLETSSGVKDIKMGYLHGIYDILSHSPRFQKVILSEDSTTRSISNGQLYWDDAERICKHDTTDVLLVLSKAVSYDALDNFNYNGFEIYSDFNYKLVNNTKWIFYLPAKQKELARFMFSDTLIITGGLSYLEFDELLYEACYASGKRAGTKLSPHWNDAYRFFFTGPGKDMRTAAGLVMKNQWVDAGTIWNRLADGPKKTLASRAAYNLALAYERDDVLDQAVLWITYSDSLSDNKMTSTYKKVLNARLKTKSILDQQMAGN